MKVQATGPRAGKTFQWKSSPTSDVAYNFVDGVCDLAGGGMLVMEEGVYKPRPLPPNEIPGVLQYLKVNLAVQPVVEQSQVNVAPANNTDPIRSAILSLDPDDDDLWTTEGAPTVDAVARILPNVTREAIDAVASDLTRAVVRGE